MKIPKDHPRAESLRLREELIEHSQSGVVAYAGLIAHGRGEAFDYLIGERTTEPALAAIEAGAATLLKARSAVISVNGNTAALATHEIIQLAQITKAQIEVNLFYRSLKRERAIRNLLESAGARDVYGVGEDASTMIPELGSERRRVDPRGILAADVVLVPLEDGDRTEALVNMGKRVIAIDLNPLSRTARNATITIVDNVTRALPRLAEQASRMKNDINLCQEVLSKFDNEKNLSDVIFLICSRLSEIAAETRASDLGKRDHDLP